MHTVDWLPPEPLSIERALQYERRFDHIEICAPILGLNPNPKGAVVLCYVGIHDQTLYTAFAPEIPSWVAIESGPTDTVIPRTERILTEAMDLLTSRYPQSTFTEFERASLRP